MKKLVLVIVSVFAVNTINAQNNEIASIDVVNEIVLAKNSQKSNMISHKKFSYLESIKDFDGALVVQNLEKSIASYNLKEDAIFDNSEKASYSVSFNQKNARAQVDYNNEGEIVKAKEKYNNVKLPYQLAAYVSKNHAGFYIKNTTIYKEFKKNSGAKTSYKIVISNGTKVKTLKFVK